MSSKIPLLSSPPSPEQVATLRELVQAVNMVTRVEARAICGAAVGVDQRSWKRWEDGERNVSPAHWELALLKLRTGVPLPGPSESPAAEEVLVIRLRLQKARNATDVQARVICGTAVDVDQRTWKRWEDGDSPMAPTLWDLAQTKLGTGSPVAVDTKALYTELLKLIKQREEQELRETQEREAIELAEKMAKDKPEAADK